jgi:predicted metal-dependent hydrolase
MGLLQLALDFFADSTPLPAPAAAPVKKPRSKRIVAQKERALLAPDLIASELPQHDMANREVMLADQRVAYLFRRGRRRTIGFSVGTEGLVVRAPGWVPLGEIDAALQEKAAWILRKLADSSARRGKEQAARIVWSNGMQLPFLGELLTVETGAAAPVTSTVARGRRASRSPNAVREDQVLRLALPADAAPDAIRDAVHGWLLREATAHFQQRLEHFAPLVRVQWRSLALTSARTRWGSASTGGAIRLNWRLMHFRAEVVDYVVVHELAHLHHMDHSPRFWAVVASVVPDHRELRAELRREAAPLWE